MMDHNGIGKVQYQQLRRITQLALRLNTLYAQSYEQSSLQCDREQARLLNQLDRACQAALKLKIMPHTEYRVTVNRVEYVLCLTDLGIEYKQVG